MKISAVDFSMAGDKYLGRSYEEMDCQAFVEKCMADVGYRRDLGGSNSWYRECMKQGWVGTPEECMKQFGSVPKGALLFILEPVGPKTPAKFRDDGVGDVTHMGIVTGRNEGAIHSSQSRGGVVTSKFKGKTIPNGGWNRIGMLADFEYGVKGTAGTSGTVTLVPHSCNESNSPLIPPSQAAWDDEVAKRSLDCARDDTGGARDDTGGAWDDEVAKRSLDCARDDTGGARDDTGGARDDTGGARDDTGDARDDTGGSRVETKEKRMTGRVVAETGRTVNLRKKPGGDLIDRINTGSVAEILEAGETWCKVRIGKKEGYMMTEFLITDEGEGSGCYGQDLSTQAQSAFGRDDTGEELLGLLSEVYQGLRNLCERIEEMIGKG